MTIITIKQVSAFELIRRKSGKYCQLTFFMNAENYFLLLLVATVVVATSHFSQFDVRIRKGAATKANTKGVQIQDNVFRFTSEAQVDRLIELGYDVELLYKTSPAWLEYQEKFKFAQDGDIRYHNYEQLTEALRNVTNQCGDIANMFSIGKSVQNRELWVIHFTDKNSTRPAFKYIGTFWKYI